MKRLFTLLILCLSASYSLAQTGNVILFTEGGEKFYAVLNGVRQNASPETNIKITDLKAEGYKLNIQFEDVSIPAMMGKNLYVKLGYEVTYNVKTNKKGEYVLRFTSEVDLNQAPASTGTAVAYTTTAPAQTTGTSTSTSMGTGVSTSDVSTTTTTTTTTSGTADHVDVDMGAGGMNFGMNVDIQEDGENVNINMGVGGTGIDGMGTSTSTSTSTSTTTTTTSTSTTGSGDFGTSTTAVEPVQPTSTGGCFSGMSNADFESAKKSIESKSFADSKMAVAKQVTKANCPTADQIKSFVGLFDFESDRLDFAKFAHAYCYDKNNYYKVNDAFEFESSIEELDEYISKH